MEYKDVRALVVSDSVFPRVIMSGLCKENLNQMTFDASSKTEAVELYKEKYLQIDIVFLELLMHDMWNLEGIKELLDINPTAYIVGTGKESMKFSFSMGKSLGVKDTIQFPFEEKEFSRVIDAYLQEQNK